MTHGHQLVERLLETDGTSLTKLRDEDGLTLAEISYKLRDEHDVKVSIETIRRWLADTAGAST